jgi:hypothetical protein
MVKAARKIVERRGQTKLVAVTESPSERHARLEARREQADRASEVAEAFRARQPAPTAK